jgi:hypothetical protein
MVKEAANIAAPTAVVTGSGNTINPTATPLSKLRFLRGYPFTKMYEVRVNKHHVY